MRTLLPSHTPATVTTAARRRHVIHCAGKRSDSFSIGSSISDWQSSCAILSSKVVSQEQSDSLFSAVNNNGAGISDLNLVPFNNNNKSIQSKKPLSISDLSPAPMHGSNLRVADKIITKIKPRLNRRRLGQSLKEKRRNV